MKFWYGTRYIGEMARRAHKDKPDVQGVVNQVAYQGDYVAWTYQTVSDGTYYTCLTLDPKGRFYGKVGIHLGADLRTNGYKFYTTGSRYVTLQDCTLTGKGTYAGGVEQWAGEDRLPHLRRHGRHQWVLLQHDPPIRPHQRFDCRDERDPQPAQSG